MEAGQEVFGLSFIASVVVARYTRSVNPNAERKSAERLGSNSSAALIGQEAGCRLALIFRCSPIDPVNRYGECAILGTLDPALFLQVPEMKIQMLDGAT